MHGAKFLSQRPTQPILQKSYESATQSIVLELIVIVAAENLWPEKTMEAILGIARRALASRPESARERVGAVRELIKARMRQILDGDVGSLLDAVDALREAWRM